MSSTFPGTLDSFSTAHADSVNEVIHASTVNDLADAVNKIEKAFPFVADYVIRKTGSNYEAVSPTGQTYVSPNADAASVLQSCITNLGTSGGDIEFAPGAYAWASNPTLTNNLTGWLRIRGNGAKITFSSTGKCLAKMNRSADYDWIRKIELSDFVIDCNDVNGEYNAITGTQLDWTTGGQRANFEDIVIRNFKIINAPTGEGSGTHPGAVWLAAYHVNVNEATHTYLRNILIEDIEMLDNGNYGVLVGGYGPSGGVSVELDNVIVQRCKQTCFHAVVNGDQALPTGTLTVDDTSRFPSAGQVVVYNDVGARQTITFTGKTSTTLTGCTGGTGTAKDGTFVGYPLSSNFQIGGRPMGLRAVIRDCVGGFSGDNSLEINSISNALIENYHTQDCGAHGFFQENYGIPLYADAQQVIYRNCSYRKTDPYNASDAWGFHADSTIAKMRKLVFENCVVHYVADGIANTNLWNLPNSGGSAPVADEIIFKGIRVYWDVAATARVGPLTICPIWVRLGNTAKSKVVFEDVDVYITGSVAMTSGGLTVYGHILSGDGLVFEGRGGVFDLSLTGLGGSRVFTWAYDSTVTETIRGSWDGLVVRSTDTACRVAKVSGNWTPDAAHRLLFRNCDFKDMAGTNAPVEYDTAGHAAYVVFDRCSLRTMPIVPVAITPGASPYSYQNLDSYPQIVTVQGGTVSKIEMSNDNTNWVDVGTVAGAFSVDAGCYLRVTYTAAPTMKKLAR